MDVYNERYPEDRRYTKEHEWVGPDGTVGITFHAQEALGDVVYVELPAIGAAVRAGEPCGAVESVKSVSDVYAPVSGTVVAANKRLAAAPELVNGDPYGEGWLMRVAASDAGERSGLLDAAAYRTFVEGDG